MSNLNETLELLKAAQSQPSEQLSKSITTATGLVAYDLQAPAIQLYAWGASITPIRNDLSRKISNAGDTATRWRAITAINASNIYAGVSEGNRGATISTTVVNKTAAYVGLGLEDSASFEATYAGQNFMDVKAQAVEGALKSLMIQEEKCLLGSNSSVALGTTPTPTLTAGTAGSLATAAAASVICVALTHTGWSRASLAAGLVQQISRTNADGSTDTISGGVAQKSANATVSVTGPNGSIAASVTPVLGAVAYAWFAGSSAGSEKLHSITTLNSVIIKTFPTTTQSASALTAADYSAEGSYAFDGLMYGSGFSSGSGAYYSALATGVAGVGTSLTSDGAGGVTEIEQALQSFYDNHRLSPDTIYCNSKELIKITQLVIGNSGAPLFRFNLDGNAANGSVSGGSAVGSYLNKITQTLIKVKVHPFMPAGTMLMTAKTIPYPMSGVNETAYVQCRRDYYQIEWPLTTRRYSYGVYTDEVLVNAAPIAYGIITNIA